MLRISRQNEEGKEMFEEVYSKIEDYCNYRIGTGYSGFSAKKGIKKFLDYCLVNFPDETTITKNMVDSWLNHRAHMSSNTQANSVTQIRNGAFFVTTYTVLHPPDTREAKKHIEY